MTKVNSSLPLQLLIDHHNVPYDKITLRSLIETWIFEVYDELSTGSHASIRVRSYGGWYQGASTTNDRFSAAEMYQTICPSTFRHRNTFFSISFEFADEVINPVLPFSKQGAIPIRHTLVSRTSPQRYIKAAQRSACEIPECKLKEVYRWMKKKRACMKPACPISFSDAFKRLEQKQVDIHLAIDTLCLSNAQQGNVHLAVVSDDIDLLPAYAASVANQRSATFCVIRCQANKTYLDDFLTSNGVRILNV